ncbi:Xyloglucan endotransglucosylase/hydrolase [Quillaja saponaria]|uniref:Xyloglucan endotransglucosylase/hydrolase n=1 Tax=Quillaja saponaria TaxID=32244 RepID=A0AAD7LQ64_QUISA|nr:Xyloglucan endotransglucosylase/hydrolase [Quillaja saponaria]
MQFPHPLSFSSLLSLATPMADPALHPETSPHHQTQPLKEIAIDYTPEACNHCPESNSIALTFDHRGGARWRTTTRFHYGTFSTLIQCPKGNTSGLNFNIYLSSLEGDKSQDEIDFEFLGKDRTIVQTNYYTTGTGSREKIHDLGFDFSDGFHEYMMKWGPDLIEWLIDGKLVRREGRKEGEGFPQKPMFLYASVWDASYIDEGRWTGNYDGSDAPYVCLYKDIRVPVGNSVESSCDS